MNRVRSFAISSGALRAAIVAAGSLLAVSAGSSRVVLGQTSPSRESLACQKLTDRATGLLNHSQFQKALPLVESAIRQDKNCGRAYLQKGYILANLDRPNEAIPFLQNGFKLKPKFAEAWAYQAMGQALFETGKKQEAIDCLDKGLPLVSDKFIIYNARGRLHAELKHFDQAIKDISLSIEQIPDKGNADFRSRGLTYMRMGKYEKAIPDFTQLIKNDPTNAYAYSTRARAYKALGKTKEAAQDTAKCRELTNAEDVEPMQF